MFDAQVVVTGERPDEPRIELAAERDRDLIARHLGQELDHVLGAA
jgi:hypothetical protein